MSDVIKFGNGSEAHFDGTGSAGRLVSRDKVDLRNYMLRAYGNYLNGAKELKIKKPYPLALFCVMVGENSDKARIAEIKKIPCPAVMAMEFSDEMYRTVCRILNKNKNLDAAVERAESSIKNVSRN